MNVWLIKDGENLPIQPDARKMRTWMLADELVRRGHAVTWWSSTHSHQRKALLFESDTEIEISGSFRLKLLFAGRYRENRSIARLLHHRKLASRFRQEARRMPEPDIVVSAFPTIELAHRAVEFAQAGQLPIIVDIRDPWPDSFVELVPALLRRPANIAMSALQRRTRECFTLCSSLVACSHGFLEWGLTKAGMVRRSVDRVFYLGNARNSRDRIAIPARIEELRSKLTGKVLFCFVGSFGHVYQLRLLCEAAAELARQGQMGVHFVLAGDGRQFAEVESIAKRLGNITMLGWLTATEVDALLSVSDVGLAPIRQMTGCVPNKLFEYSAAGLPILSSLEGEAVGILAKYGAGLSYIPGDLPALVSHIMTLAHDTELRRKQAQNSKQMFEYEFDASRIYSEYADHVESIARAKGH